MQNDRQTALITGASGGLGRELATLFARDGENLLLVARNSEKLNGLKSELETTFGVRVALFARDLSEPDAAQELFDFASEQGIAIDTLVNNAGLGDFGPFCTSDREKQSRMIRLNISALTELTRLFLPGMIERKRGSILNVASVAAFQPGPLMSVYYASKAYVLSFSEALSEELKGSGVTVTTLCPGPTKTGFESAADLGESGLFKHLPVADAREVAEFGYRQLRKGKVIAIPGAVNRLLVLAAKFSPRAAARRIAYLIQR